MVTETTEARFETRNSAKRRRAVIPFDLSRVPEEKRNDPRLLAMLAEDEKIFRRQNIGMVCHEALHGVYHMESGAAGVCMGGPRFAYDAATDTFTRRSLAHCRVVAPNEEWAETLSFDALAKVILAPILLHHVMILCGVPGEKEPGYVEPAPRPEEAIPRAWHKKFFDDRPQFHDGGYGGTDEDVFFLIWKWKYPGETLEQGFDRYEAAVCAVWNDLKREEFWAKYKKIESEFHEVVESWLKGSE
jgi:hypothetical protein